jgi:hypothetical protein
MSKADEQTPEKTVQTGQQTVPQTLRRQSRRQPKDTMQTPEKTENTRENRNEVSEQVSVPLSVPVSGSEPRKEITQAHLEQATAVLEIAELLASGKSVREVVKDEGFSKTLVEKVSSGMNRTERTHPKSARAEYLERPYRVMVEKEQRAEGQNFLSDKISSMVEDALLLSLQVQVYRDVLGLGKQKNGDDLFEKMMLAKVVGGGQNLSGKELIEFAAALKSVLGPQQTENFVEKYAQLENIKNTSIEKYKELQVAAFQQAKQAADRGIVQQALDVFAPTINKVAEPLLAAVTRPQGIPKPTPQIPEPLAINPAEMGQVLSVSEPENLENLSLPDNQGYTNLTNLSRFENARSKTKLQL